MLNGEEVNGFKDGQDITVGNIAAAQRTMKIEALDGSGTSYPGNSGGNVVFRVGDGNYQGVVRIDGNGSFAKKNCPTTLDIGGNSNGTQCWNKSNLNLVALDNNEATIYSTIQISQDGVQFLCSRGDILIKWGATINP
jgi:hypothetical protein